MDVMHYITVEMSFVGGEEFCESFEEGQAVRSEKKKFAGKYTHCQFVFIANF